MRWPWPRGLAVVAAAIVAALILLGLASRFLVDWLWFSSLGFGAVFWTTIVAKAALFAAAYVATACILWLNAGVAVHFAAARGYLRPVPMPWDSRPTNPTAALLDQLLRRVPWRLLVAAAALVVALPIAAGWTANWTLALNGIFQVPYGHSDPLFGRDFSFYLFSLPLLVAVKNWLLLVIVLAALFAGLIYYGAGGALAFGARRFVPPAAAMHGSVLLGAFFAVLAWSFWLARYQLLYSDNGVVVGASFTDVHVRLPVLTLLAALALIAALASFANVRLRTKRIPLIAVVLVFGTSLVLLPLGATLFENVFVKPNELKLELPYIARNIALTREAYDLSNIVVRPFTADETLTYRSIEDNRATIDNIRLWDQQPLLDTYSQLQEIRTYYRFFNADIDRYTLGGTYQQVMLSARELDSSLLSPNAQTWVNQHLLFTHGNGVVMSPVTRTSPEGLPVFDLQNIPPVATGGPPVTEPRIYFGEGDAPYAIVKTGTPEFDYPKGSENAYRTYDGAAGV